MKKILAVAIASIASAAASADGEPAEEPIVAASTFDIGTLQIPVGAGTNNVFIPVCFKNLSEWDKSEDDLPLSQIMKVSNLNKNDQLIRFNGTKYDGWIWSGAEWTGIDGFTLGEKTTVTVDKGDDASGVKLLAGEALWLKRIDSSSATTIQLFGKFVSTNDIPCTIVRGRWNLLSNPTMAYVGGDALAGFLENTKDSDGKVVGPQLGDKIIVVMSGGLGKTYLYSNTSKGKGWYRGASRANPELGANCGFWYYAKNGEGNTTFRWAAEE